VDTLGLVDTGCSEEMVDRKFIDDLGLSSSVVSYDPPRNAELMDGTLVPLDGTIRLPFKIGKHKFTEKFLVMGLGTHNIALGHNWIKKHNPDIDWVTDTILSYRAGQHARRRNITPKTSSLPRARAANTYRFTSELLASLGGTNPADQALAQENKPSSPSEVSLPVEFQDFADIFNLDYDFAPPKPTHGVEFKIHYDGPLPPPTPNRPMSPTDKEHMIEQVRKLEKLDRIEKCTNSETAAMSFFVRKQCTGCHQLRCTCGKEAYERRWVVDYRPLNALEKQDAYPLPSTPELLSEFAGKKSYAKFDIDSAFYLIPVRLEDRHKTAFLTPLGLYQWKVMPMGLKNAPATFQRMIDTVLNPCRLFCRAFMDDGIIKPSHGDTEEEQHESLVQNIRSVFSCLRAAGLRCKLRKCRFFAKEVDMLGHVLSENGVSTDPAKLQGIIDYRPLRTKTDVRAFLGVTGYYCDFVPRYAEIALPLTAATRDDAPATIAWDHEQQLAWQRLKDALSSVVTLAVYDPSLPVQLFTDASTEAYGGVIEQEGRPLAFFSGKFKKEQRGWSTTDRELYPCLRAHEKFGYLLQGKTVWYTDHQALKALRSNLADNGRRVRWRETLDQFPFSVEYKKGTTMHVDGLTRHSENDKSVGSEKDFVLDQDRFSAPMDVPPTRESRDPANQEKFKIKSDPLARCQAASPDTASAKVPLSVQLSRLAEASAIGHQLWEYRRSPSDKTGIGGSKFPSG